MILSPGSYGYADLELGACLETGTRMIDNALIDGFAQLSGDRYEIHMSETAAKAKGFKGRVAHGLLVLSVIDGMKNNAPARFDALASLGWDWDFKAPVLSGDQISARFTVREKRLTRSGNRGLVINQAEVFNQHREIVQSGRNTLIFDL